MGCCGGSVEEESRIVGEPQGPVKDRGCTDIFCLLIFVAFLIGWGVIGAIAIIHGDPEQLFNPTDSYGNICGVGKFAKQKYLFYFDMTTCASPTSWLVCPTSQVCVSRCPNYTFAAANPQADLVKYRDYLICKYNINVEQYSTNGELQKLISNGDCAPYYLPSSSVVRRCLPNLVNQTVDTFVDVAGYAVTTLTDNNVVTATVLKNAEKILYGLNNVRNVGDMVFSDFKESWVMMAVGIGLAMALSFLWIMLIRLLGGLMVWFTLIAMFVIFSAGCGFSFYKYKQLANVPGSESKFILTTDFNYYLQLRDTWLAFGIIAAVFLFIVLLIVIFLRKRIAIAIQLINESSKAVAQISLSLFFPIFPFILQLAVISFWIVIAVFLASMGSASYRAVLKDNIPEKCKSMYQHSDLSCNISNFDPDCGQCVFYDYASSGGIIGIQVYNLFGMIWVLFFIDGLSQMILAGAFASWYWAYNKPKDIPACPIGNSVCRTFGNHLGTIAFGSLIIAIVRLIRIFLEFLDRKLKQYSDNAVSKCIMCFCRCFCWCLENFLKYINKNAYIMVAIYGKSFCASARDAFSLLLRNVLRAVVLDKVTDFLLFVGKLVIAGGLGALSFFFFSQQIPGSEKYVPTLNYYYVPVIVITFGSYMVASAFFGVYEMAVDTVFLCFLEDCERHDGVNQPYFMSKNLMKILGKHNKAKED
ncbi:hypothetical protein CHUAL_009296 [Chamberlinius hualienensis]